ncbi:Retrovirus-related Pol polyprotein from transposon TNT 1-94 [Vitis vinifera]|uniref:Retrovirus-related Pol polyprotein from transposon TNT 1-94 n=1 Tax=Vitis vinifera TaxID=29760 RepID=A0A438CI35_VITVI|nr:Retrovirus-related Pol polyprotein from transposon TNT 1-94 [Vitis vinifera]
MMDLDMTLREDEPPKPTNESTEAMRAHYAKRERSNRLSPISIKRSIAEHLLGGIPESNNAKEFLVAVANRYQTSDNAEARHFMDELMNMSQIKSAYNTLNQSWGVNDLITKCVAKEEKLKREKNESAHLVALGKPNNKKKVEKTRKPNFHSNKKNKNFKKSGSEKQKNGNAKNTDLKCYHCNKKGHKRVDCFKFKNWLEKKKKGQGMLSEYVCFESNLVNVPLDSWWLDSGATVHVATSLQGIRNLRKPSEKELNLKVGSDIGIDVEHIGMLLEMFKVFRTEVEKQLGKVIKIVRSDRGGEYYGKHGDAGQQKGPFARYLQDNGIVAQYTMPGSSEQNGVAERRNRTLMEMKRSMMGRSNFPEYLWGEAIKTTTYILNRVPRVAIVNFPTVEINPIVDEIPPVGMRRSQRTRRSTLSNDYYVYLGEREYDIGKEVDPTTYYEALSSDKANEWLIAMRDEMQSMSDNDVWELVDLPKGYKPIGCKWVFKTKRENKGNVERYKARLVMALVAHFDLELHQMDVKIAFLNGDLSEEVYMSQPEGFKENGKENMVCRLKRSIYGLKQASRQWYLKFDKIVTSFGFIENKFDQCVYMKVNGSKYIFMVLYIDDILLASSDISKPPWLSQRAYINRVLKRFNMQMCKAGDVQVVKGDKLSNEQCPKNDLEKDAMKTIPYASAIGSLMYAQVCTRPDIAFIVNVVGRYLSNPGHDHWVAAKKVMRYLQRTKDFMLVYRKVDNLEVVGYSDSDFGGCSDDRKSTLGYIFMLAGGAISWKSAKQSLIGILHHVC